MISTLARYRLIMLKNRFATMPAAEKLAYAAAALVIIAFIGIITKIFMSRMDRVLALVTPAVFKYFNYVCIVMLNMILAAAIFIEAFTEVHEIYYRRETQFLNQFPHEYSSYYIFKLFDISLKMAPVLLLLFPFYLIYAIFFSTYFSAAKAAAFVAFTAFAIPVSLFFSASLSLVFTVVIARILSLLRQRTIILLALLGFAASVAFYLPMIRQGAVQGVREGDAGGLRTAYERVKEVTVKLETLPPFILGDALTLAAEGDLTGAGRRCAAALFITALAAVAGYYISRSFLFRDIGMLMDSISLRQGSTGSLGYFGPLAALPPVVRGAVYDEIAHSMRKNSIISFVLMFPAILVVPFYLPPKFFEAVRGKEGYWVVFMINCIVLLYGSELMASDVVSKRSSLQLLRAMPVRLADLMLSKAAFYASAFGAALAVSISPWLYFMGFGVAGAAEAFALTAVWSMAASLICHGASCLAGGMFSLKRDPDGLLPADPAVGILAFILLGVMCIGSFRLQKIGVPVPAITLLLALCAFAGYLALKKGASMLEKKEF